MLITNSLFSSEEYQDIFHTPYPNNFIYMLVPKYHSLKSYAEKISKITQPLNIANLGLLTLCEELIDDKQYQPIKDWRQMIDNKTNLNSIFYAQTVLQYMEQYIFKTTTHVFIKKHIPRLLEKFIDVPDEVLKLSRINIYIDLERSCYMVKQLVDFFQENRGCLAYIDRLEIAKENLENLDNKDYPKLIIYLSSNNSVNSKNFQYFLQTVKDLLSGNQKAVINEEYSFPWTASATLTEGYRLYKRFLNLLGILNEIYDESCNFAFSHENKDKWLANLNS